jgi:peroxin-6
LERWLVSDPPILRQGDVHVLKAETPDAPAHRYRIEMIEPVQQGCVDYGTTRLVLTLADRALRDTEIVHDTESPPDSSTESDPDGIEIDERFFACSVLSTQPDGHFGQDSKHDVYEPSTFQGIAFHATPLLYSISEEDDCTLYFRTSELSRVGVLNRDWVKKIVLSCSGALLTFSSQAIAYTTGVASSRLVRVVANDDLVLTS